ncbi:hypothetical protein USB125703_01520 [Pseudoclavibacter triregionum]|nr:hypothetical protein USB125703_01520 [Pseudoclavibacter triregionum]
MREPGGMSEDQQTSRSGDAATPAPSLGGVVPASAPCFEVVGAWGEDAVVVATAIHTGHELREEVAEAMALDEDVRFREEDPFTERIGARVPNRVDLRRSRFEVDLNRDRDGSVYRTPEECWGLEVWHESPLDPEIAERSREEHDAFYAKLRELLDPIAARGPFVLYDLHSYNHRRDGAEADAAPQSENPDVNVGTGSLDRERWGDVVDVFLRSMSSGRVAGEPIDARENVRFQGANLAKWVHETYPDTGCCLALEFKKTFMDEWTGVPDETRIGELAAALEATLEPVARQARARDRARGA